MQILSLTRICSNVDTSHWFLGRTVSPSIMQYYFLKWKSLIGWMSFTYFLSTHVTVLLSVDICFSRRFVGLFHQGFKSHYLSSGSMILQWHFENCPNIWRKFWKYTHNWPWKEEKKKHGLGSECKKKHSSCFLWQFYQQYDLTICVLNTHSITAHS